MGRATVASAALAFLLSQYPRTDTLVKDEGTIQGRAQTVNCTGSAVACSVSGGVWTLNGSAGPDLSAEPFVTKTASGNLSNETVLPTCSGTDKLTFNGTTLSCAADAAGSGLPADPAACTAGQYVTDQNASGTLTCAQVAYSQLSGTPTVYYQTVQDEGTARTQRATINFTGAGVSCVDNAGSSRTDCTITSGGGSSTSVLGADIQVADGVGGFAAWTGNSCTGSRWATALDGEGTPTCATMGDDQVWVGDSVSAQTKRTLPSCSNATTSKLLYDTATNTFSCGTDQTGGGGSPGGSSTQVQYNNAGAFGGISQVTTDGTNLVFTGTTTEPAAPAAGSLKLWAMQPHGSNGPVLPLWKGGATQVDYRLFPELLSTDPLWGCLQPAAWGSTTITPTGSMAAGTATGTAATVAWATTDAKTRAKWVQFPAAATANTSAGYRANLDYMWRGNAAGLGGWYWWGSVSFNTVNPTMRAFIGLKDATAVITATSDPNTALDAVYFGCNAADSNLSICSNDNVGTATCTTLGANFPCHTTGSTYDVALWAQPNGSSIGYYISNVLTANTAQGTVSSDLPRNTVALGWDFWVNTGSTASALNLHFGGTCYIANP